MKFKSAIITQASGSVGGLTFAHNQGGLYTRARSIPTDPGSSYQVAVRNIVGQLVAQWANTLSAAQRAAWAVYAENVPLTDVFGDPKYRSGINHYVRSNTPILQAGLSQVDDGPTVFSLPDMTAPSVGFDATADEIDVTFDNTDDWANEDDAAMLVYCSRPQNASREFFKGPYRYAGKIDGDSVTPPTSPAAIALPFAVEAGHKVFALIRVVRADGRLSTPFRGSAIAA